MIFHHLDFFIFRHAAGQATAGFSTYAQLSTTKQRGFEYFYGFLDDGLDYLAKTSTSSAQCQLADDAQLSDFWEDDAGDYSELLFAERGMDLLDAESAAADAAPFFVVK